MGLFALPPRATNDCTAEELVQTAEHNIKLWRENRPGCSYLLDFATSQLAAAKVAQAREELEEQT